MNIPDIKHVKHADAKAQARAIRQQLEETYVHPSQEVAVCSLADDDLVELAHAYADFNAAVLKNDKDAIAQAGARLTKMWDEVLNDNFVTIVERTIKRENQ